MNFRLDVAPRRGPRASRVLLNKKTGIARRLEEIGIEYQLGVDSDFHWGQTVDANGTRSTIKQVGSITRLGASVGQTSFTKLLQFGASVKTTDAS
jgi:hypothetical protein